MAVDASLGVGAGEPTRHTLTGLIGDQNKRARARPADVVSGRLAERLSTGTGAEVILDTPPDNRLIRRSRVNGNLAHGVNGQSAADIASLRDQRKDLHWLGNMLETTSPPRP